MIKLKKYEKILLNFYIRLSPSSFNYCWLTKLGCLLIVCNLSLWKLDFVKVLWGWYKSPWTGNTDAHKVSKYLHSHGPWFVDSGTHEMRRQEPSFTSCLMEQMSLGTSNNFRNPYSLWELLFLFPSQNVNKHLKIVTLSIDWSPLPLKIPILHLSQISPIKDCYKTVTKPITPCYILPKEV